MRKKILVIDDDQILVDQIFNALKKAEMEVYKSYNSEEGYNEFLKIKPDLAIIDLFLPGTNGLELCRKLKQENKDQIPVFLITGLLNLKNYQESYQEIYGVDEFFPKPIDFERLLEKVKYYLDETVNTTIRLPKIRVSSVRGTTIEKLEYPLKIGTLSDTPFPELLNNIYRSMADGILVLEGENKDKGKVKRIYFKKGHILFAKTNLISERLSNILLRARKITPEDLERIEKKINSSESKKKWGEYALEEMIIQPSDLEIALRIQTYLIIKEIFTWQQGNYHFEPLTELPEQLLKLKISTADIIMSGVRTISDVELIRKYLPKENFIIEMNEDPLSLFQDVNLSLEEKRIIELVDGVRTFGEIIHLAKLEIRNPEVIVYGLISVGVLKSKPVEDKRARPLLEVLEKHKPFETISSEKTVEEDGYEELLTLRDKKSEIKESLSKFSSEIEAIKEEFSRPRIQIQTGIKPVIEVSNSGIFSVQPQATISLAEKSVPELLFDLYREKWSGIAKFNYDSVEKSLLIKSGKVVFANSSLPEEKLGNFMLKGGLISQEQLKEAEELLKNGFKGRIGDAFVKIGAISYHNLYSAITSLITIIIRSLFSLSSGNCTLLTRERLPKEQMFLDKDMENVILDGIRHIENQTLIDRLLPPLDAILNKTKDGMERFLRLNYRVGERQIFFAINGKNRVSNLISLTPDYEDNKKFIIALKVLGLVEIMETKVEEKIIEKEEKIKIEEKKEDIPIKEESDRDQFTTTDLKLQELIKGFYEKLSTANYYEILNVPRTASFEEIRKSYRNLAKIYHPDVVHAHKLSKYENMVNDIFAKLNEAFNVLSNLKLREAYDRKLKKKSP